MAHAHQALTLLAAAIEQRGKLFTKGENSILERLHCLHSDAKHADSRIQNGASAAEAGFTVWMADKGLHSNNSFLSWKEAASIALSQLVYFGRVPSFCPCVRIELFLQRQKLR